MIMFLDGHKRSSQTESNHDEVLLSVSVEYWEEIPQVSFSPSNILRLPSVIAIELPSIVSLVECILAGLPYPHIVSVDRERLW